MWVEFVVGFHSCPNGFSWDSPVYIPPQKPISNSTWKQWKRKNPPYGLFTVKFPLLLLVILLDIMTLFTLKLTYAFQITPGSKADLSQAILVGDEIVAINGIECTSRAEAIELVRCSRQKLKIALRRLVSHQYSNRNVRVVY